jgi:hypothetical protein
VHVQGNSGKIFSVAGGRQPGGDARQRAEGVAAAGAQPQSSLLSGGVGESPRFFLKFDSLMDKLFFYQQTFYILSLLRKWVN